MVETTDVTAVQVTVLEGEAGPAAVNVVGGDCCVLDLRLFLPLPPLIDDSRS